MRIGEVEKEVNISKQGIRYYETLGLIESTRLDNGYRDYSKEAVATIIKIKQLQALGLSLDDIKIILQEKVINQKMIEKIRQSIQSKKEELDNIESWLNQIHSDTISMNHLKVKQDLFFHPTLFYIIIALLLLGFLFQYYTSAILGICALTMSWGSYYFTTKYQFYIPSSFFCQLAINLKYMIYYLISIPIFIYYPNDIFIIIIFYLFILSCLVITLRGYFK